MPTIVDAPSLDLEHAASLAMIKGVLKLLRLELDDREVEYKLACEDYLAASVVIGLALQPEPERVAFHRALTACSKTSVAIEALMELEDSFTPKVIPVPGEDCTPPTVSIFAELVMGDGSLLRFDPARAIMVSVPARPLAELLAEVV